MSETLVVLPESPIKQAMDLLDLSVQDMCAKTRLSHSTVTCTISGMYPTPNYQIIRMLDVVNPNILDDYQMYRIKRRRHSIIPHKLLSLTDPETYLDLLLSAPSSDDFYSQPLSSLIDIKLPSDFPAFPEVNPHIEFRQMILDLPITSYCEELCIERFNVQHLEANESLEKFTQPIYSSLILAIGIKAADELANAWRDWHRKNPEVTQSKPLYVRNQRERDRELLSYSSSAPAPTPAHRGNNA